MSPSSPERGSSLVLNRGFQMETRIALLLLLLNPAVYAQQQDTVKGLVPTFPLEPSPVMISQPARPAAYFDKIGRKAAVLGYENGTFEAWIFPLKILRNFELSFLLRTSTESIKAEDIVKRIDARPEATTLTYVHESFTVKETFIAPLNESGVLILIEVHTIALVSVIASFLPVLQPMWPAGLGGQYSYWDDGVKAYIISESTGKIGALVGSPLGVGISSTPAHMLSDAPNQFKIDVEPGRTEGSFIPIVIAGGKMNVSDAKRVYSELVKNPEWYYRESRAHFDSLRTRTLRVVTPDKNLNLVFEWGKVAFDNLLITNPDLGTGLVAGFGPSGTSGRPGFGWYFGGDAFINSYAINSYQAFETVRDALAFTQKWQRTDGKMAHELSQAAGYVDWFKDYHFGYIHADTTPYYIAAMGDYLRATGDTLFLRQSWESVKKAYEWCLSTDENGDGLMDNSKAGLGALEFGPLTGIQTDIYLSSVWVEALQSMGRLTQLAGDEKIAHESQTLFSKARQALNEKFWDEQSQSFIYGWTKDGKKVTEITPWPTIAMFFHLLDGEKAEKMLEKLHPSALRTDWGVRLLSTESKLYEPLNYNYGAVWPFINGFVGTAEYSSHNALNGYELVDANARHAFENGLGVCSELYSGETNTPVAEAVPHQGFSSFGFITPFVRGLLGLEVNVPERRILFAPHLSASWDSLELHNLRMLGDAIDFSLQRESGRLRLHIEAHNSQPFEVFFSPALPFGSSVKRIQVNGVEQPIQLLESEQDIHVPMTLRVDKSSDLVIEYDEGMEIIPPERRVRLGDPSEGLRIISFRGKEKTILLEVEGRSGKTYSLRVKNAQRIASVAAARLSVDELILKFPPQPRGGFVRMSISIQLN
jgi:glycogen debranching enzyme